MNETTIPLNESRRRIESVDVVRGVIMIVMALDHVRDFFGVPGVSPTDPARAGAALFFTRWVTHFCAPVFFLLTGTGAYLSMRRKTVSGLSQFLLTRGFWLILLELTLVRCLGFQFNVDYRVTMLLVLWALGWSMIVLSALVYLPVPAIAAFGLVMITGHNLLDGVRSTSAIWAVLHRPGFVFNHPPHVVFASYPLVPWIGVTAAGFSLGRVYDWAPDRRRTFLLITGAVLTVDFVILRAINVYGDPSRWQTQQTAMQTLLSFLNTTKYPPSLLFLLMTLGPALLMLRAFDGWTPHALRPAVVYGRVPMFYFVLHLPLIHLLAIAACYARYDAVHWMFESPDLAHYPFTPPPGWGFGLPVVYAIWVGVVLALYPLCRWFAAVKQRRRDAWLSYL
jgi:uncharacterized membrane protein